MSNNQCYTFQQTGQCKYGANCRFSHGDDQSGGGQGGYQGGYGGGFRSTRPGPCYAFQESGQCKFGSQCRFSHGGGGPGGADDRGGVYSNNVGYQSNSGYGFSRSAGPCYEFRENGSCKYGDNCRFSHSSSGGGDSNGPQRTSNVCYQFKNAGNCSYGQNCRFSHDLTQEQGKKDVKTYTPRQTHRERHSVGTEDRQKDSYKHDALCSVDAGPGE